MEIVAELLALCRALEKEQIDYAVCGGLAITIHGRPRLTVDIDLVVPREEMSRATRVACLAGFDTKEGWVPLPKTESGIDRLFRLTKFKENEFLTLDLLEADSEANEIFASRKRVSLGDDEVTVLSKDAIIKMKLPSDRTKDRLDIEMLQDDKE